MGAFGNRAGCALGYRAERAERADVVFAECAFCNRAECANVAFTECAFSNTPGVHLAMRRMCI